MDYPEIENTDHWLGSPTELETIRHYAYMLENEIQELTLQLRTARKNIFTLVQANSELATRATAAAAELGQVRTTLSNAYREHSAESNKLRGTLFGLSRNLSEVAEENRLFKLARAAAAHQPAGSA